MEDIIKENNYPNTCPYCWEKINPKKLAETKLNEWWGKETFEGIFTCNNKKCNRTFTTLYEHSFFPTYTIERNSNIIYHPKLKIFNEEIEKIFEKFCKIYNQSFIAEENQLEEIAWIWYRKAFEFLLKDYLIHNRENEEEKAEIISNTSLTYLINKYINNNKLKEIAEKCAWLWNDHWHYLVKHTEQDLEDLKNILDIIIHFIEMDLWFKKYSKIQKK